MGVGCAGRQESGGRGRHDCQQLATAGELGLPRAIGEQAVVTDAHEAGGNDVEQEATQELLGPQFHDLWCVPPACVVFVAKADDAVADEDQTGISNGHAVGVAAEILQDLLGTAPRRFGVDHPRLGVEVLTEGVQAASAAKAALSPGKGQPLLPAQSLQPCQILAPEDLAQSLDGKEKAPPTAAPLCPI